MPINPIASIKQVYQSIPGQTAYHKTTFLGKKALQITPFVAMGYYVRGRVSSGMVIACLDALPLLAEHITHPQLLKMLLLSFGIGLEVHRGLEAAKMCKSASSPATRFAFFCTTYAAAYYATSYFRSLYKEPDNTEAQQSTVYSPVVDFALKCIALPIQFKYRPLETIAGLSAGAFFAKNNLSSFIDAINMKQPPEKQATLNEWSTTLSYFLKPSSKTNLATKIWNEWNRVILAVAAPTAAFNNSLYQGKELIS
jgi:hypothetical protein